MNRRDFIKQAITINAALAALHCGIKSDKKIKVVILGFDGANWPTIDPLIKKGKLPFLKKFKEESAWANFKTFKPAKSNVVWTSIATGKTMVKHGIMDFAFLEKSGIKVPYSKSERKAPMIWQILDTHKKRSVVVNWWVSHPPDKFNGVMVSDHFRRILLQDPGNSKMFIDSTYPKSYFNKIREMVKPDNYTGILKETGLPDLPQRFKQLFPQGHIERTPVLKHYRVFTRQDYLIEKISDYLFNNTTFDFFATYFRLPDVVQHSVTHVLDKEFKKNLKAAWRNGTMTRELHDEAILRISDILEPVYGYMERIIKKYINDKKHKDTYFFIMSDHGFSLYPGGYNHYALPSDYDAPGGILMIKGPEVKNGMIKQASVFDISPTILNLFGLPIGKNMDGRVLKEIFKFKRKMKYKVYKLEKDGKIKRSKSYDKESLEELKSIGYID